MLDRLVGGHIADDAGDGGHQRVGIDARVNEETAAKERQFLIGGIVRYLTERMVDR